MLNISAAAMASSLAEADGMCEWVACTDRLLGLIKWQIYCFYYKSLCSSCCCECAHIALPQFSCRIFSFWAHMRTQPSNERPTHAHTCDAFPYTSRARELSRNVTRFVPMHSFFIVYSNFPIIVMPLKAPWLMVRTHSNRIVCVVFWMITWHLNFIAIFFAFRNLLENWNGWYACLRKCSVRPFSLFFSAFFSLSLRFSLFFSHFVPKRISPAHFSRPPWFPQFSFFLICVCVCVLAVNPKRNHQVFPFFVFCVNEMKNKSKKKKKN